MNDIVGFYLKLAKLQKQLHYDTMILISKNIMETTWKIIKTETGKTSHTLGIQSLKINNTITDNHIMIANTFNKYFLSVADSISVKIGNNDHANNPNLIKY
jgi:hypothetical protein